MFHMMNEARIGVGMAATMLGMAGYEASLDYARQRPQGRPIGPGGKDPASAAGAHHPARRRQAHAAGAEGVLAKGRWRWSCTAPAWSTSSTPASPQPPKDAACCWRC
jgi:hypothetical protein